MTLLGAFLVSVLLFGVCAWFAALILLWMWAADGYSFETWQRVIVGCLGTIVLFTTIIYAVANADTAINWFQSKTKPMTAERGL